METSKELQQALLYVQQNLNAPKNKRNNYGGYNYRSCEDILLSVKPLLKEVGAILTLNDEIEERGGELYIKATATFICSGMVSVTAYAREERNKKGMDAPQMTGACSSYARKYALNGLFAIDDAKDPDTDEFQRQNRQPQAAPKATPKPQAAPQPVSLNDAMKSVQSAVKLAQTRQQLIDIYNELKEKDKDLAELMQDDFKKRLEEITNL